MGNQKKVVETPKLSEKEKQRAKRTVVQLSKSTDEGYKIKEVTISPLFANIMSLFWGIVLSIPTIVLYYLYNGYILGGPEETLFEAFLVLFIYVFFIVLHEAIHGVFMYMFNGKQKDAIEFGINSTMPYCTCQSPIKKWQYAIVLIMPTIVIGILLSAVSIFVGKFWWLLLTVLMISGGGGDFTILAKLLSQKESDLQVVDHPYKCGFLALSKTYQHDDSQQIIKELSDASEQNDDVVEKKDKTPKIAIIVFACLLIAVFVVGLLSSAI